MSPICPAPTHVLPPPLSISLTRVVHLLQPMNLHDHNHPQFIAYLRVHPHVVCSVGLTGVWRHVCTVTVTQSGFTALKPRCVPLVIRPSRLPSAFYWVGPDVLWGFSIRCYGKTWTNFLAKPIFSKVHLFIPILKKEGFPFIKTAKNTENFKVGETTFLPKK